MATPRLLLKDTLSGNQQITQAGQAPVGHMTMDVNIIHEIGKDSPGTTLEEVRFVEPSATWTQLSVKVHLTGSTAAQRSSVAYMATVRRRKASALKKLVDGLAAHEQDEDFFVHIWPLLEGIKELLETL